VYMVPDMAPYNGERRPPGSRHRRAPLQVLWR
jgi:hypothetical protein